MNEKYEKLIELGFSKGFDSVDENEIFYLEDLVTNCIPTEKINYAAIFQLAKIGLKAIEDGKQEKEFTPKEHTFAEMKNITIKLEKNPQIVSEYQVAFDGYYKRFCFNDLAKAELFYHGLVEGWETIHSVMSFEVHE